MNLKIGQMIYSLRKEKNMTQENLASEMGVSIAAVSKWETSNSIPDIVMLCALADFFDVTSDKLLGREKKLKKMVIADDAAFMRETLKHILEENDCTVVGEAENGESLLKLLKEKTVDGVVLDINMPVMDGMAALEEIKKNYPNIDVIMCSAVNDKVVLDKAILLGASAFITKPFLPEAVVTALNMLSPPINVM